MYTEKSEQGNNTMRHELLLLTKTITIIIIKQYVERVD